MIRNGAVLLLALMFACFANDGQAASRSVECVQTAFNALGFPAGPADGVMGKKTRTAASAYLASNTGIQGLPDLSNSSAGTWCAQLAKHHDSLHALLRSYLADLDSAAKTVKFRELSIVFAGDVTDHHRAAIEAAAREAEEYYSTLLGTELSSRSTMYVSGSPAYLARTYVRHRGTSKSVYARKQKAFAMWITGEATYDGIFINTSSKHFGSSSRQIRRLIFHELYHLYQYQLVGPKTRNCCRSDRVPSIGPQWLFEGAATYMPHHHEGETARSRNLRHGKAARGDLGNASLRKLETRHGLNDVHASYAISSYAVQLLVERNGVGSLGTFYRELGKRGSWREAFDRTFGVSVDEFYSAFID